MNKSTNFASESKRKNMKYTRNQINRAGDALIGDPFERQRASEIVTDWRQLHLPVLRELNEELTVFFKEQGVPVEFSSHRIKRMQSIIDKLRNHEKDKMKLGGLQDIGGVRFVFSDTRTLDMANRALDSFNPKNFEHLKCNNYVEHPQTDGYRSIHHVYKYMSENPDYNGLRIELQIRTKLQHCWAMAVETAGLITRTSLKVDIDDGNEWRKFFRLVSAVFSKKEGRPILVEYSNHSDESLCSEFFNYSEEHKLIYQLRALRVAVDYEQHKKTGDSYCVLIIDFNRKRVKFRYYDTEEIAQASEKFTEVEGSINSDEAALMVSMKKIEELQKAYPSYFLDTGKFIEVLDEFEKFCELNYPRR